jgi:hypothetical protein
MDLLLILVALYVIGVVFSFAFYAPLISEENTTKKSFLWMWHVPLTIYHLNKKS